VKIPANRVYLVRHGRTASNREKVVMGRLDLSLDDEGRAQADRLRPLFDGIRVDRAFCSPLSRARETAARMLAGRGIAIDEVPGLAEQDYGDLEGKPYREFVKEDPERARRFFLDPASAEIPGGEPFHAFAGRVIAAYENVVFTPEREQNLLVVAHGGSIRILVAHLLGLPPGPAFFRLWLDNASVTVIDEFARGMAVLTRFNWLPDLGAGGR
jgi:broad specificity phosphatase PhoE